VLGIHSSWAFGIPFTEPHRYLNDAPESPLKVRESGYSQHLPLKTEKNITRRFVITPNRNRLISLYKLNQKSRHTAYRWRFKKRPPH
ncbi:MAG: hypothetical protein OQL20_07705, partial [Sedimenticola sp.]|nr:hypothetical protein [Sedimenticola sp.]